MTPDLKMGHFIAKGLIHHVSICSCNFTDTAQYSISALNVKGEASYVATVVVKSKCCLFVLPWQMCSQRNMTSCECVFTWSIHPQFTPLSDANSTVLIMIFLLQDIEQVLGYVKIVSSVGIVINLVM